MKLEEIINRYEHLWMPCNFVNLFKSMDDFEDWARTGSATDIRCTLDLFETEELFEHCEILLKIYKEKTDEQFNERD